jgi:hypothetical protein
MEDRGGYWDDLLTAELEMTLRQSLRREQLARVDPGLTGGEAEADPTILETMEYASTVSNTALSQLAGISWLMQRDEIRHSYSGNSRELPTAKRLQPIGSLQSIHRRLLFLSFVS